MNQLPAWLTGAWRHLRKFYTGTLVVWLVWITFIDDNNLFVVWENRRKMKELERDRAYYREQVKQVRKERQEVFGTKDMMEKWAREKYLMRKPGEDVYVIVDEEGRPAGKEE